MVNSSSKNLDRKFNNDIRVIAKAFNTVSPENKSFIARPMGKLIGSYVKGKVEREINKSLYAF